MGKVLFLVNHDVVIYNFRLELVEKLLSEGFEVYISSPYGERIEELKTLGCHYHEVSVDRHGKNIFTELKLLKEYRDLINKVKPDVILGFTIKPNIYGAIAAAEKNIPFIANITGLGTALETVGMTQKALIYLYKFAFRKVKLVFFQNKENSNFFIKNKIALGRHKMLPGSGVNIERFQYKKYPDDTVVRFAFISRIMKEKGIEQYLSAAEFIKNKHSNVEFHICGFCEPEYKGRLNELVEEGVVKYHGMVKNISKFLEEMHCVVHPTYYPEGLSNVLLEASASGRPIITTDRAGCREVVCDELNGYMIPQKDYIKLIEAIEKFLLLSCDEKCQMGIEGRNLVEQQFNRKIVVEEYMKAIDYR